MTTPPSRLRRGRDIRAVFRHGRRRGGTLLSVHARAADGADPAALAVVASRRVGTAVDRNRAKRLMREAARRLDWRDGWHVVLVARPACAGSGRRAVEAELAELADGLDLLEERQPADV